MPRVGNRHFAYTPAGQAAAKKALKRLKAKTKARKGKK